MLWRNLTLFRTQRYIYSYTKFLFFFFRVKQEYIFAKKNLSLKSSENICFVEKPLHDFTTDFSPFHRESQLLIQRS